MALNAVNTWELVDLGVIPLRGVVGSGQTISLEIDLDVPTSDTFDIDALIIFPIDDRGFLFCEVTKYAGAPATQFDFDLFAHEQEVRESANDILQSHSGNMWDVKCGNKTTRFVYMITGDSSEWALGITVTVTYIIYPRTRHLLGTS